MAVDWDQYPASGRTQYFAGSYSQRPCGVGYGYRLKTTGANNVYAQFNFPTVVITDLGTDENALQWDSEQIPSGFITPITLLRDFNPFDFEWMWTIVCDRLVSSGDIVIFHDQALPNLRTRFTTPPAENPPGEPLEHCPNPWTVTPMTKEEVLVYQGS